MTMRINEGRRNFFSKVFGAAAAALLAGCDALSQKEGFVGMLSFGEWLSLKTHRLLIPRNALAREFTEADISRYFKPNGSTDPADADYKALVKDGFARWRLTVDGLVERPAALSMDELRAMPSRTQITRHDCVEGWSCIGKWKGVPLAAVLERAGLKPQARYIVFHCLDTLGRSGHKYYESVDLVDAFHPQTILAYDMNDRPVPVAHGAPLRLRVERQLGYKMAKYVTRVEAVENYAHIAGGKGGHWEDRGYEWYAGI
jgi:DMSO/TMAO reductase YedYZ molybdopterin-dependent catalytic subunit